MLQGPWETLQQRTAPGISITWQELFPLVKTSRVWGEELANRRIVFYCDKASFVSLVNSKRSRIPWNIDLRNFVRLQLIGRGIT